MRLRNRRAALPRESTPEERLAALREALADAERERAEAKRELEATVALDTELSELTADEYVGTIDPADYDRRQSELETRRRGAHAPHDKSESLVEILRGRCADLAEAIAGAALAVLTTDV